MTVAVLMSFPGWLVPVKDSKPKLMFALEPQAEFDKSPVSHGSRGQLKILYFGGLNP